MCANALKAEYKTTSLHAKQGGRLARGLLLARCLQSRPRSPTKVRGGKSQAATPGASATLWVPVENHRIGHVVVSWPEGPQPLAAAGLVRSESTTGQPLKRQDGDGMTTASSKAPWVKQNTLHQISSHAPKRASARICCSAIR